MAAATGPQASLLQRRGFHGVTQDDDPRAVRSFSCFALMQARMHALQSPHLLLVNIRSGLDDIDAAVHDAPLDVLFTFSEYAADVDRGLCESSSL